MQFACDAIATDARKHAVEQIERFEVHTGRQLRLQALWYAARRN